MLSVELGENMSIMFSTSERVFVRDSNITAVVQLDVNKNGGRVYF